MEDIYNTSFGHSPTMKKNDSEDRNIILRNTFNPDDYWNGSPPKSKQGNRKPRDRND